MSEVKTAEEIAQDHTAMGHSVELINGVMFPDEFDEYVNELNNFKAS